MQNIRYQNTYHNICLEITSNKFINKSKILVYTECELINQALRDNKYTFLISILVSNYIHVINEYVDVSSLCLSVL